MVALLGTNGAGKSTLLRAVSGLSHPHRGVVRIFGMNSTYLEPEQIIEQGVALLVGGKMTFSGLTVRDNLRVGGHTMRRDRARSAGALAEAHGCLPRPQGPPGSTRRHPVGRGAADARPGPGHDDPSPAVAHRRAGPRPGTHDRRRPHGHGPPHQRGGHHGDPGRAEHQPRHQPGAAVLLHRARRDPFRRSDGRAPPARRSPAAGLPRRAPRWAWSRHGRRCWPSRLRTSSSSKGSSSASVTACWPSASS